MASLKNPFAIKDEEIIVISDLTLEDRGLKCDCKCPNCKGDFIARMGNIKIHHFAHSGEVCDDILAYTIGLLTLVRQSLINCDTFYVPALMLKASGWMYRPIEEDTISNYIDIIPEWHPHVKSPDIMTIAPGRNIKFESADFAYDSKSRIEALVLSYRDREVAVKVVPPKNICKTMKVTQYQSLPTLVLDFSRFDTEFHSLPSSELGKIMIGTRKIWQWISNPKIEKAYPKIIEDLHKKQALISQRDIEERKRLNSIHVSTIPMATLKYDYPQPISMSPKPQPISEDEGYSQVKDLFTIDDGREHIKDSSGRRWIKCKVCAEVKPCYHFAEYGGANAVMGICSVCNRHITNNDL